MSSDDNVSPFKKPKVLKNNVKIQTQKRNAGLEYITLRSKKVKPARKQPKNMVSCCEFSSFKINLAITSHYCKFFFLLSRSLANALMIALRLLIKRKHTTNCIIKSKLMPTSLVT